MSVITRFAPSPTGYLHVGNVRTALVNWLFARKNGGKFILRIDDTDRIRSEERYVDAIKRDLEWLGLTWDEIYFQSDRMDKYEDAKQRLIDAGRLYPCFETQEELEIKKKTLLARNLPPIYDRAALKLSSQERQSLEARGVMPHYRFLMEQSPITWSDGVKGKLAFEPKTISDPILIRGDGTMTYMIATVIDDIDLNITNIVRGEDHVSNSAIHYQMFAAFGAQCPSLAHLSLVKSKDGEISKRLGGFDIHSMREAGLHPMSILSFLAKIGTSDPIEFRSSLDELVDDFDLSKFSKSPTSYDENDLKRLNEKLTHVLTYEQVKDSLPKHITADFWEGVKHNLQLVREVEDWYNIIHSDLEVDAENPELLKLAAELLPPEPWDEGTWNQWIASLKERSGLNGKALFMPLRLALTGMHHGPELQKILPFIGYETTRKRLVVV